MRRFAAVLAVSLTATLASPFSGAAVSAGAAPFRPSASSPAVATPRGIAYSARIDGQADLFVAARDGSGAVDITNTPGRSEVQPAFSPDGERLVFRIPGSGLWLIGSDGSAPARLTTDGSDASPSWSPDGTEIVFSRCCDAGRMDSDLFIVGSDGSNLHQLLDNDVRDEHPDWSPDGQWIAFGAAPVGVFIIHPDGTGLVYLMSYSYGRVDLEWAPDSIHLAMAEFSFEGESDLFVISAFDSSMTQLTTGPATDRDPAWSPDGRKIAFARSEPGAPFSLFVMNAADGTGIRPLTSSTDPAQERGPTWQPAASA